MQFEFQIVANYCDLRTNIESYQEEMFHGEMRRIQISFFNQGNLPITKMLIAVSHPEAFGFETLTIEELIEPQKEIKVQNTKY